MLDRSAQLARSISLELKMAPHQSQTAVQLVDQPLSPCSRSCRKLLRSVLRRNHAHLLEMSLDTAQDFQIVDAKFLIMVAGKLCFGRYYFNFPLASLYDLILAAFRKLETYIKIKTQCTQFHKWRRFTQLSIHSFVYIYIESSL